ncbi:MAG: hypothetical protein IJM82_06820 [Synergistaceae bacterium]|nr:hypothetical protein [Synergistaceae bacterium]
MDCHKHEHDINIIKSKYKRVEKKLEVKIPTDYGVFTFTLTGAFLRTMTHTLI